MKRLPLAAALLVAVIITIATFRVVRLETDIAGFLPRGDTPASRFMLGELQGGATAGLVMVGIEGASQADLARIARATAAGMESSGEFRLVAGATPAFGSADEDFLFAHRYLFSPVTTAQAFTTPALQADLQTVLQQLQSSAAPIAERYGLADPPGAFLALVRGWMDQSKVRAIDGVWFSPDGTRALLLARLRAGGVDMVRENQAISAVETAFAAAAPGKAHLLLAGPAVIARNAARQIKGDVERISVISSAFVAAILLWRFRSLWVVATIAVPVLLSLDAAAIAVWAVFGQVQGAAFGFGMTMLGVTVDYPVLLIGHRKRGEPARDTLRRIGGTLALAVASAAIGLTGMVFCGFPGLAQIGLFSVVGVVAAAVATIALLPRLIVAANLAPASPGTNLLRIEAWRGRRIWMAIPIGFAAIILTVHPPRWQDRLAALSPAAPADQALDQSLRADLGAAAPGRIAVLQADSAEAVLTGEETLAPILAGTDYAARFLPSIALQHRRQADLPDRATLAARMRDAASGLPFRDTAFEPFLDDVAASQTMAAVTPDRVTSPALSARLDTLLIHRDRWYGLIMPHGGGALPDLPAANAFTLDLRGEADRLVGAATRRAGLFLGLGAAAVLAALVAGLRGDLPRVARVAGAVGAALVITLAVLDLAGTRFSLLHVVALQFVAGIGLDYALFFARRQVDAEERARTLRTLATCNMLTLATFGTLACCHTPLLREIGLTVAIGAFSAMVLSFFLVGPMVDPAPHRDPL